MDFKKFRFQLKIEMIKNKFSVIKNNLFNFQNINFKIKIQETRSNRVSTVKNDNWYS